MKGRLIQMAHTHPNPLLPYDAVLFDLDGTLTESEPGIINSVKYSLEQLGHKYTGQYELSKFIGPPLFESYTKTLNMDAETARRGVQLYRERFSRIGWQENSVYMGIPHLLRSLKQHGAYIALASSKPTLFCEKILRHFGLFQYFDKVIAARPEIEHSDKPELVREALPVKFRRAVMVGDRKYDCEGGLANGIDVIGALYGYGSLDELKQAGATHIAASIKELTAILLGECEPAQGLFISLEGSDGCGKTTQMNALTDWLVQCGHDVLPTREPGGCPISERIRTLVLDASEDGMSDVTEALLFAASRAQHVYEVIRPAIMAGRTVLCDRYVDSSIAYQGAGRNLGIEVVRQINAPAVGRLMPDITVFFDIDPKQSLKRRTDADAPDRIEQQALRFMQATSDYYHKLSALEPNRVHTFDASGSVEQVAENLKGFIAPLL